MMLHVECPLMGWQELEQVWALGSQGTPCREYPGRMAGAKTDASQEVSELSALGRPGRIAAAEAGMGWEVLGHLVQ